MGLRELAVSFSRAQRSEAKSLRRCCVVMVLLLPRSARVRHSEGSASVTVLPGAIIGLLKHGSMARPNIQPPCEQHNRAKGGNLA